MIQRERLVDEFLDLVRTASLSRREGRVAKRLVATLEGLGAALLVTMLRLNASR